MGDKKIMSFGTRRVWPYDVTMVEYATTVGGFDDVSNVAGAKYIGKDAVGTMLCFKSSEKAFEAFRKYANSKNIALIDTYGSPKSELFQALGVMGKDLYGVRIDSGDLKKSGKEIRWELDVRDRNDVKLFCSGGLDEYSLGDIRDIYDGFGVGTKVADARTFDFALKIIEVDGEPQAKFGNYGGKKQVYRNGKFDDIVTLEKYRAPEGYEPLLKPLVKNGKIVAEFERADDIRKKTTYVLKNLPPAMKEIDTPYTERVDFRGCEK